MPVHAHYPHVLIDSDTVGKCLTQEPRLVQVDFDPAAFGDGHLEGAISWNWMTQLRNQDTDEILNKTEFERLMSESGISEDSAVILYGDNNNWFACWAFWLLTLYGHRDVFILDGGIRKWINDGRRLSTNLAEFSKTDYAAAEVLAPTKATTENIFESFFNPETHRLVDVRSTAEYEGRLLGPGAGAQVTCAVGGHIPTAINVPWNLNCNADGTFKSKDDLAALYASFDIGPEKKVITYCAVGERASLSWFVLKHLLGYEVVMNYDRSMAQWSRIANAPIVKGEAA